MSDFSQSNLQSNKAPKTKAEYSRNIKKLKVKLMTIEQEVGQIQKKIRAFSNTSNDKMIALKISKFCKERRITPEMLYRCADRSRKKSVTKGQFKETLIGLGLKLTQHQLTRLEYLLDEDISGEISEKQYNQFLIAFRIKGQFSAEQQFINQIFKKVIDTNIEDNQNKDPNNKNRHLLNYEQFLKYCHRHLPHMKHKQIASIFNILQRNNMIDIDQFLQYIKKKKQQSKELENKNKKNELKKLELTDIEKLKGIIKNILNNRKDPTRPIFHSFEFSKLQRDLKKQRGQLLQLFKQIDKQRKGSFGFNQLIQYYIDKTKDKDPDQIVYAYEIMGIKISVDKEKPEDVLNRYNGGPANKKINLESFKKFMLKQFGVIESDAEAVFRVLSKRDNEIPIRIIIDAMKLSQGQKKTIYIKPTLWNTESKDFLRKNSMTILFNPFVALRFCLIIVDELKKAEQTYWDDYQFGPTFEDPFGSESIGFESISVDAVKWLTVESLGMKQFYPNEDKQKIKFISTNQCPHDKFAKTLCQLIKNNQLVLESSEMPDYKVKHVQDANLRHLFEGLYPLIFRSFAAFGIYVFRFYSRQKWVYVLTDNKIPCTTYNEPLFSQSIQKKHSWISLIQKGYAKMRGNYAKLFNVNSNSQYIHELNRKIPIKYLIGKQLKSAEQKNKLWQLLLTIWSQRKDEKVYGLISDSAVSQLIQSKVETGFQSNVLNQVIAVMQIQDQKCQNQHKSHRLTLIKADLANIKVWNPNWNSGEDENKYDKFLDQIQQDMRKKQLNPGLLRYKNINVINFKLFRNIFNQIFALRSFSFQKTIILRKIVQFEQKFSCRYELNSKQSNQRPLKIYITLNRIRGPADTTIQIILKSTPPKQQAKLIHTEYIRKNFGACELTIGQQLHTLQIKVQNWHQNQDHVYTMTFYMDNPMYHMRQLDRQQLFRYVGQYQEMAYLDIKQADEKERLYIYRNYFKAAERGNGCCG